MMRSFLKKVLLRMGFLKIKFLSVGKDCLISTLTSTFVAPHKIEIGDMVSIGPNAYFDACGGIEIGNKVILAPKVTIYTRTHNFDSDDLSALPFDNVMLIARVKIEDYVWIGNQVIILPGVRIGRGAIVGAGAVVAKDVPDYAVVVGNPARVVKFRNQERFDRLSKEDNNFVYQRYGHAKVFRNK